MEQILDNFIAVAVVFLLLSLVVKGIQDIAKYLFDNKEKAMLGTLNVFIGQDAREGIQEKLRTFFGQNKIKFIENFTPEQFRVLIESVERPRLQNLPAAFGIENIDQAKDLAVQQFSNALTEFQAIYERNMAWSVFGLSLIVVVLFNANLVPIYESIRTNAVTRQGLVAIAEEKYKQALADLEDGGEVDLQQKRDEIQQILTDAPIIMRGVIGGNFDLYWEDLKKYPVLMFPGLIFSAFLVYLGAPFWHDLLQSLLSAKNVLRRRA